MFSLVSLQVVALTEVERRQNPFVEQNDGRAEADPCSGGLSVFPSRDRDVCRYSRDVECRVQRRLGRLRLLDLRIDRGEDGAAALAGRVARSSCLVFRAHCVCGRRY